MNPVAIVKGIVTLWQAWSAFRRKLPPEVRALAAQAVQSASVLSSLGDHTARREYAVVRLMRTGIKENTARLAVEAAVAAWKHKEK